ncbi:hypothetical protein BCR34DRAFT_483164 [Clohesyomyces aquaticus]|uniref:UBX domain-containing protein n=1 Tax=Clohesyomyces aquaticus TaxID=1231657 RepID=A0A1Y1ZPH5_9PLEO|nr:hypothetical protein BCR34DRAFT_483164 [Clohesyomyces aquaticus]
MDEEAILNFVSITSCDPDKASQYLRLTENNLEQAIQLYFDSPNLDFGTSATPAPAQTSGATAQNPLSLDSEDEDMTDVDAADAGSTRLSNVEDDEAMARRLQEEMYGGGGDPEAVRAPIARVQETLVGPGSNWGSREGGLDAMVQEQLARRRAPGTGRVGIFNQRGTNQTSVWENNGDEAARQRELATVTGGASQVSSKSSMLAEMYRPPFEIMFQQSWDNARDEGKEKEKWIIVNIQDPAIFDCQILNRDIWKNTEIKATVKESFVFMQYAKDDPRGQQYINYYFHDRDNQDAYPHIAIVDPRTGEQVKVWSGPPVPNPLEFHAQLHEFLDRYSLKANAKNPVAQRKPERKKVDFDRMTEEEQLEMALQKSLENSKAPKDDDPDELTKGAEPSGKGKAKAGEESTTPSESAPNDTADSPFTLISASNPHIEPAPGPLTTRIQFRDSEGKRIVRRFNLSDPVRRIYEWLKASPWEGKEGAEFDLILSLKESKNLINFLDSTVEEAGLKNATVNVEFLE